MPVPTVAADEDREPGSCYADAQLAVAALWLGCGEGVWQAPSWLTDPVAPPVGGGVGVGPGLPAVDAHMPDSTIASSSSSSTSGSCGEADVSCVSEAPASSSRSSDSSDSDTSDTDGTPASKRGRTYEDPAPNPFSALESVLLSRAMRPSADGPQHQQGRVGRGNARGQRGRGRAGGVQQHAQRKGASDLLAALKQQTVSLAAPIQPKAPTEPAAPHKSAPLMPSKGGVSASTQPPSKASSAQLARQGQGQQGQRQHGQQGRRLSGHEQRREGSEPQLLGYLCRLLDSNHTVLILCVPSLAKLAAARAHPALAALTQASGSESEAGGATRLKLAATVHLSPPAVVQLPEYQAWVQKLPGQQVGSGSPKHTAILYTHLAQAQ